MQHCAPEDSALSRSIGVMWGAFHVNTLPTWSKAAMLRQKCTGKQSYHGRSLSTRRTSEPLTDSNCPLGSFRTYEGMAISKVKMFSMHLHAMLNLSQLLDHHRWRRPKWLCFSSATRQCWHQRRAFRGFGQTRRLASGVFLSMACSVRAATSRPLGGSP